MPSFRRTSVVLFWAVALLPSVSAQYEQQGPKLVGTGGDFANQGSAVAISADGNTVLIGGPYDDSGEGAAWVFTRVGDTWTQQGLKLVGTGAVGDAGQGTSVALSADGNTAVIGGPYDDNFTGAVWVFTRSGGVWTQQGGKLVGSGGVPGITGSLQGSSVALSADGNTLLVGGSGDDSFIGAVWVWTRTAGVWTQQGSKLIGTGAIGTSEQGFSVALSADGDTALVGGPGDDSQTGAAWVFTRSAGVWTQQGQKFTGTGGVGNSRQAHSVALSADGNTALLGGPDDASSIGAVWVFLRTAGVWAQQGPKLVANDSVGDSFQGSAVSLVGDGSVAMIGGPGDNDGVGATWVWIQIGGVWYQVQKLIGTGAVGESGQGGAVALSTNGLTAVVGGPYDAGIDDVGSVGAAWIFVLPVSNGVADGPFQVRYVANLNVVDSLINLTNTGANGAMPFGPGIGPQAGNICVNVYAFSPDEQMVGCCSCHITPNGLASLSVYNDIRAITLTGLTPNSMVIKLVATGTGGAVGSPSFTGGSNACTQSAAGLNVTHPIAPAGLAAWVTTGHIPGLFPVPGAPAPFGVTETRFTPATLSEQEVTSLNNRCTAIIGNGSTFGTCRSCSVGGRGGSRL